MKIATLTVEARIEATHWWFRGRRKLITDHLKPLGLTHQAPILEIGTGTGSNLRLLKELGYTNVIGIDLNDKAIHYCWEKGLGTVEKGDVCDLPFGDNHFRLILATDILEHVDDNRALCELSRVLLPGGFIIITVPAFQVLWGLQDEVSHHKRRYRQSEIEYKVHKTGLTVINSFYFNTILFFPIWIARQIIRLTGIKLDSENQLNNQLLNRVLEAIFLFDVRIAPWIRPPFGVSIMVVATKRELTCLR